MSQGFIQIPRSLLDNPSVVAAPLAQRWLLITIIQYACFMPCQIDDHQVLIDLKPGDLCCSLRQLAKWAGIDKNDVERGIERFSKVKILRQEVRHRKSIISIIHLDTYDLIKSYSETPKETKVRQERDKSETQKDNVDTADNADTEEKPKKKIQKEKVKIREWVEMTQDEIDKIFHIHGDRMANAMLDILDSYNTARQQHYKSDYGALKKGSWVHTQVQKQLNPISYGQGAVDKRTRNIDGTPVASPHDGRW